MTPENIEQLKKTEEHCRKTEENFQKTEETEESRNQTSWEHVGGDPHFLILQFLQFFESFLPLFFSFLYFFYAFAMLSETDVKSIEQTEEITLKIMVS